MNKKRVYNLELFTTRYKVMAKMMTEEPGAFGKRLAELRKKAGFTQKELATEIGATRRMIAYYETESDYPPTNLLAGLASALAVSVDELLGITTSKTTDRPIDSRLQRRFQQIEKLPVNKRRQLVQVIDTYLEAAQVQSPS